MRLRSDGNEDVPQILLLNFVVVSHLWMKNKKIF